VRLVQIVAVDPRWGANGRRRRPAHPCQCYRGIAARVTDEQIRMALLELAAKYEALAREMQQTTPPKAP
jgi:hypothetical protein